MECRICDYSDLELALDLGMHPRANEFLSAEEVGNERRYPLRVVYCPRCQGAQLDYTIAKEEVNANHTYLSGVTRSLSDHFKAVAEEVDRTFFQGKQRKSCLDIGSNDGTQLAHYQALGYEVLGVDPARLPAQIANQRGIPTLQAFFNVETADQIGKTFDVFNAAGVFFHLEELHSVTAAIQKYLAPEGVFVVQFIYVKSMMENGAFDQIYHEHLLYYSLRSLETLLERHGLELFDARLSPIHGGSVIGFAGHRGKRHKTQRLKDLEVLEAASGCNELAAYRAFGARIEQLKEENLSYLLQKKREGKRVFGMGAPVKGNTLLNYFGIGKELLDCLVEKNRLRRHLFSPGMHFPIVMEDELSSPPDVYYVLAWNFKREILANNQPLIKRGVEFYFPIDPQQE
jgi:2-polyprenyl-3-methyl-5-hydroxy-6-metoxy-1,4-benzoquinol methylase